MCDYIEMYSILGMFDDDLVVDVDEDWDLMDPPIDVLEGEDEDGEL